MNETTFVDEVFAVTLGGVVSRTVVAPIERIKIILQVEKINRVPDKEKYKSIYNIIINRFILGYKKNPKRVGILILMER
jgi:hypothetical protein